MKFKKQTKRLHLNKETIARLNDVGLSQLKAGIRPETEETCEYTCEDTCFTCDCPTTTLPPTKDHGCPSFWC